MLAHALRLHAAETPVPRGVAGNVAGGRVAPVMAQPADADVLAAAYRFCEATRNRLFLVASGPGDALPSLESALLLWLARSLDTKPSQLREDYRRVTRRARRGVERLFYGQ